MSALLCAHAAGGIVALLCGFIATTTRKGGALHVQAGRWFVGSMLLLGITGTVLARLHRSPGQGLGGIFICYLVATAWVTARSHDGVSAAFEKGACSFAISAAAVLAWLGMTTDAPMTPAGRGPVYVLASVWLVAGLLDLRAVLRGRLTQTQRLVRHLWRMGCALFVATASFAFGPAIPAAWRGSPLLLGLACAPLLFMIAWLVRVQIWTPRIAHRPHSTAGAAGHCLTRCASSKSLSNSQQSSSTEQ